MTLHNYQHPARYDQIVGVSQHACTTVGIAQASGRLLSLQNLTSMLSDITNGNVSANGEPKMHGGQDHVDDLLTRVWQVQGLAASTIGKRLQLLRQVGGVDATYGSVMAYLSTVTNQNTRRTTVSFLRTTFRAMIALDLIERDPMVLVPKPKVPRWEPDPFTPDEVATLEQKLTGPQAEHFTLALYAGLRAGELANLEGSWLRHTYDGPMLRVFGKGGTDLSIPAHPKVVQLLESKPRGRVYPQATARSVSKQSCRAYQRLGIEGGIHRARHTFALRVLQASEGDLLVVRDLLRHASVATVQHYVACLPNAPRRVLDSIA